MISIREHPVALSFGPFAQCLSAFLLVIVAGSGAGAQTAGDAIYGVTALDVAPGAASQGVALLKQYRDGALKQAGNTGVILLQEADWPNRFVIYEAWTDQAAYDANERAVHSAELRAKLASMGGLPTTGATIVSSRWARPRRQEAIPSTCSCISMFSRRHRGDLDRRAGGGRGCPQGRWKSALRRRQVGQAALEPHDPARRLAEPPGVRELRKFRLRAAIPRCGGAAARLPLRRSPLCADQLTADPSGERSRLSSSPRLSPSSPRHGRRPAPTPSML